MNELQVGCIVTIGAHPRSFEVIAIHRRWVDIVPVGTQDHERARARDLRVVRGPANPATRLGV